MKWRLSSDSCSKKEILDAQSMSFTNYEHSEVISGNKFSLTTTSNDEVESNEIYKPRTSSETLADQLKMQSQILHQQQQQQQQKQNMSEQQQQQQQQKQNMSEQQQQQPKQLNSKNNQEKQPKNPNKRRLSIEEAYKISDGNYYNNSNQNNVGTATLELNSGCSSVYVISSNNINSIVGPKNSSQSLIQNQIQNQIQNPNQNPSQNPSQNQNQMHLPAQLQKPPPQWRASSSLSSSSIGGGISSTIVTASSTGTTTFGISTVSSNNNDDLVNENSTYPVNDGGTNNDFHYVTQSSPGKDLSSNGSFHIKNGSTSKLLPAADDQSSTQTKCSVFRGLVLCICLNITYANIVRFPRELDRFGTAYLIPYLVLLFLVGLPIILLEISIGQFLGQGAAHTWRTSPIFKGACIVSRLASWLASIWISLQAVHAIIYIVMLIFKSIPFSTCVGNIKITEIKALEYHYKISGNNGQDCIKKTFLMPVWEDPFYFGLLTLALIVIWSIVMICTHNAKIFRRMTFFFGLIGFGLLTSLTGWEIHKSVETQYFPNLWSFDENLLIGSNMWFSALVQVIYSTNIGFGVLPVITGKFLYKGDAVRTSVVYLCFNLLIKALAFILFMVQFENILTRDTNTLIPELKPLTSIYDRLLHNSNDFISKIIAGLVFGLISISAIITIITSLYTSSRLVPRHPNYIISLVALVFAIGGLVVPDFGLARILDSRIVGTLVITALVFDLIATTWIYGAKNIYTDLEFSIGRPIFKSWLCFWCFAPVILTGILTWWCVGDDQFDLYAYYIPRWAPIVFVLAIILLIACLEIFKQVDYNFFGMICEAAKSAKEWGPADPLARHAWKTWRSVCQDTGRKDFTLRRRGTRDYTHSIKKGQYSTAGKYGTQNWKTSTTGSSSPNYSGSVFGDSAIEEDMSVHKYSGINHKFLPYQQNAENNKPLRYSNRSRRVSHEKRGNVIAPEKHKEVVYIRRLSNDNNNHATRIEITPTNESTITYGSRNPLARSSTLNNQQRPLSINLNRDFDNINKNPSAGNGGDISNSSDHICWRKFSVNSEEYSTEL